MGPDPDGTPPGVSPTNVVVDRSPIELAGVAGLLRGAAARLGVAVAWGRAEEGQKCWQSFGQKVCESFTDLANNHRGVRAGGPWGLELGSPGS